MQLEDLGFCEKGQGGNFVADGNLISGVGKLPFNTDGGGLCNNHPANRGGMTKVIEAVRQLRGEAHPKVQVPDCTWPWRMARAACSAPGMAAQPSSWKGSESDGNASFKPGAPGDQCRPDQQSRISTRRARAGC